MSEYFYLLPPQEVPSPTAVQDMFERARLSSIRRSYPAGPWRTNVEAAEETAAAMLDLERLASQSGPIAAGQTTERPVMAAPALSKDDSIHDEYFFIRRCHENPGKVFLYSILKSRWILFDDAWASAFSIEVQKLNLLDDALEALYLWLIGSAGPSLQTTSRQGRAGEQGVISWSSRHQEHHSMLRWIRGHQIFAVLTQGLITAFREIFAALKEPLHDGRESDRLKPAVDLTVLLLQGSAAALEFTADFPSRDYNELIRPSMTPPLVPETFSGLLSADHRFLVHSMRAMKPSLDDLAKHQGDHHRHLASALASVYDSHRFVCDRLVGKSPSLMMATGSHKSGAEQVEKFKQIRLKVFTPEPSAEKSKELESLPH